MAAVDVDYEMQGEGPPLYMVHGIGSRKVTWNALITGLADRFTCVSYDLRGHGASPVPPTPYTLDDLVDDLEALRKKLGHDRINIIGHSLGGMIGPAYARAYPDRTITVGLLSTAAGRTEEDRAKLENVGNAMQEKGIGPVLDTFLERWYTDEFIRQRPNAIKARRKQVVETPVDVFMSVFWIYARTEMAPWLHQIECPCLVLTGELDGGCNPRLNQFMADQIPDSELIILKNLKHSILIEGPDQVLPPLRDFLLRHIVN
jgi:pimeloyl-ACP methyl ester carboxylesterase